MFSFALFLIFVLCSRVNSLHITVSPKVFANSPSVVAWTRNDSDPDTFEFDLRFFSKGADAGLAAANLRIDKDETWGFTEVVFPVQGSFELVAVTGPDHRDIGKSNKVVIFSTVTPSSTTSASTTTSPTSSSEASATSRATTTAATSSSTTSSSTSTPSSSTSAVANSTALLLSALPDASKPKGHPNLAALVGGILGGLAFLALLATLVIFIHRRRAAEAERKRRATFHRSMMVQRRLSRAPSLPAIGAMAHPRPSETFAGDIEQGLPSASLSPTTTPASALQHANTHLGHGGTTVEADGSTPHRSISVPSPRGPRPSMKAIGTITTRRTVTGASNSPVASPRFAPFSPGINSALPTGLPRYPATPVPATPTGPTRRQREIAARIGMLRRQMADLTLEYDRVVSRSPMVGSFGSTFAGGVTDSEAETDNTSRAPMSATSGPVGRAAEIRAALDDMGRQMVWLREHEAGAWALGLTDVVPPGHARYMRP